MASNETSALARRIAIDVRDQWARIATETMDLADASEADAVEHQLNQIAAVIRPHLEGSEQDVQ